MNIGGPVVLKQIQRRKERYRLGGSAPRIQRSRWDHEIQIQLIASGAAKQASRETNQSADSLVVRHHGYTFRNERTFVRTSGSIRKICASEGGVRSRTSDRAGEIQRQTIDVTIHNGIEAGVVHGRARSVRGGLGDRARDSNAIRVGAGRSDGRK